MVDHSERTLQRLPRRVLDALATHGLSEVFEHAAKEDARAARIQALGRHGPLQRSNPKRHRPATAVPAVVSTVHALALRIRTKYGPASGGLKKSRARMAFSAPVEAHSVRDRKGRAQPWRVFQEFADSPARAPGASLVRLWSVCSFRNGDEMRVASGVGWCWFSSLFAVFWDESHAVTGTTAAVNRLVAGSSPARGA
jgi:hypothetical protein